MSRIEINTRDDRLTPEDLAGLASPYPMSLFDPPVDEGANHQSAEELGADAPGWRSDMERNDMEPRVRAELATSLHFILSQYLRPSTLRRLIGPRDGMIGRVMLGRSMQGEVDDDLLARVLAQAVVEHIRQSGFVVRHCPRSKAGEALADDDVPF